MTDIVDARTRSRMMSAIRGKDTKPELTVRRGLHRRGLRYGLHDRKLPGSPDLVCTRHGAVIMINGCFWHKHECPSFHWPDKDAARWREKLEANAERDRRTVRQLLELGWRVLIVWECSIKGKQGEALSLVLDEVEEFVRSGGDYREISG